MFQKNKIIILIVALLGAAGAFFYRPQQTYAAGFSGMTFYHRFLINCWGDSMTAGQGGNGVTYPRVLKELTGFPVNNFGVSGETTYEIVDRSAEYGDQSGDIMIIEMGDNGTWRNMDDLIKQYQNMLDEADCSNYIIISSTDDPNDTDQIWGESGYEPGMRDTWYEAALKDAFGEHVVTARKYLIENGLSINGLDETDEDRERAEKGLISLQLRNYWIDNTHLNGYGYRAQAHAVYEKGIELGYWFANGGDVTSDGWIVVEDDVIQADYTGMALNEYGWWYFNDGVLDESYTGMAVNEYGWWYFNNGLLDLDYTGMAVNEYGWWYFNNGYLDMNYTGMAVNEYGWWYFNNGLLDLDYTGMAVNEYGWWYFNNGYLDMNYTGMAVNEYGWWYFSNGYLDMNYTGMALNEYGWWYFNNGYLDMNYTGIASNEYGSWYYRNGTIAYDYSGTVEDTYSGKIYTVQNGLVIA